MLALKNVRYQLIPHPEQGAKGGREHRVCRPPCETPRCAQRVRSSELGTCPTVADTGQVLDLRKAGVDRQELLPDPLYQRTDI